MSFFRVEQEAPIGPTVTYSAPTLQDLLEALQDYAKRGGDMTSGWNGWDDESLVVHNEDVFFDPRNFVALKEDYF